MNSYLTKKLTTSMKTESIISQDYKALNNIEKSEISFFGIRGSVRMLSKKILTRVDVENKANHFLNTPIAH